MTDLRPGETREQRADRNFGDILQETRVLQTGVQVLFAFLLTVPFQARFVELDDVQRATYLVALTASAAASVVLASGVGAHRALFGRGVKHSLVRYAHVALRAGLALLGVAITAGVVLIADFVVGRPWAVAAGSVTLLSASVLWQLIPMRLR